MGLAYLPEMRRLDLKPTLVTYNALMLLCSQVGRIERLFALFDEMLACCVEPDFDCYGRLLQHAEIDGLLHRELEILQRLDSLCGNDAEVRQDFRMINTS